MAPKESLCIYTYGAGMHNYFRLSFLFLNLFRNRGGELMPLPSARLAAAIYFSAGILQARTFKLDLSWKKLVFKIMKE